MPSITEIENAFSNHCAEAGVIFTKSIIADSVLHRAHVEGDKPGTKNGAYILHIDSNPSGWFRHFVSGAYGTWTLSGKRVPMTAAMRQQIDADRQQRKAEQQQRHNDAAQKAGAIWRIAAATTEQYQSRYLMTKHVQPHGLRLRGDALVVPIYDEHKHLVNLQFIQPDGTKRFMAGGKKKGCYSFIGKPTAAGIIQIAEGWATSASLYEATGHFTVVALDAGNLEPVALVFRRLYPDSEIIICGDNDESGTGQKAARSAALAVGGKYIIPTIVGHDFNDMLTTEAAQ